MFTIFHANHAQQAESRQDVPRFAGALAAYAAAVLGGIAAVAAFVSAEFPLEVLLTAF